MKFNEMSTEKGFDLMLKLAPFIGEIVEDDEIATLSAEYRQSKKASDSISTLFPLMMKKHREALYGMLAAAGEKTVEEIKEQTIFKTKKEFENIVSDDIFDFFILFLRMAVRA